MVESDCEGILADFERNAETSEGLESVEDPPADAAYWKATLSCSEPEVRAHFDWADETLEALRGLEGGDSERA